MTDFVFKALSSSGRIEEGSIAADSLADAQRALKARGLTLLACNVAKVGAKSQSKTDEPVSRRHVSAAFGTNTGVQATPTSASAGRIKSSEILRFTSELAVLLKAGLPLDRAIKVQIDSAPEGPRQQLLQALLLELKGGRALSIALESRHDVFGTFYISMVRSGEASGNLSTVLAELASYLERAKVVRGTVISALIYPAILAVVALLSIAIMLGYVVPEFEPLFNDMGDALPWLTRAVVALGEAIASWGWLLTLLTIGVVLLTRRWLKTSNGAAWLDLRLMRLPLAGTILRQFEVARFARTLGTLLGNGVPMLRATDIACGTVTNALVSGAMQRLAPAIKRGDRLSNNLDPDIFSPVAIQMIKVGEESGSLNGMLLELAQVYEADVEANVKRALTLLEPALILGMGGMIAIIIMAILMGILSVNTLAV